jgi:hypothetical protein
VTKTDFLPVAEFLEESWQHWGIIPIWEEALPVLTLTVHWTIKPKYSGQKINKTGVWDHVRLL